MAHQELYHSGLYHSIAAYIFYSNYICMVILMSIVHEVINIVTLNLIETCI